MKKLYLQICNVAELLSYVYIFIVHNASLFISSLVEIDITVQVTSSS